MYILIASAITTTWDNGQVLLFSYHINENANAEIVEMFELKVPECNADIQVTAEAYMCNVALMMAGLERHFLKPWKLIFLSRVYRLGAERAGRIKGLKCCCIALFK